jgi:hypothetical protein
MNADTLAMAEQSLSDGGAVVGGEGSALESPGVGTEASAAPCEGQQRPGELRGVQVIVCVERSNAMVCLARWRVYMPDAVGLCDGDEVAGLAYLERVVKRLRERRGL